MNVGLFGQSLAEGQAGAGLGRRDHLTFRGNVAVGRHGWLRLTPAYSLHLVRELLRQSDPDEFVLDPFAGTGTTPLVCASLRIPCHGVELNPFLVWFGNLKLAQFDDDTVCAVSATADQIGAILCKPEPDAWRPDLHAIAKWWDQATLDVLAAIYRAILAHIRPGNTRESDLLKVAFCRVLIQTANVSFGHQSMSFKKKKEHAPPLLPIDSPSDIAGHVLKGFVTAVTEVIESLNIDPPQAEAKIFLGDSRDVRHALPVRNYTTVITSPPYPNRMSYIRELRPYMYWLGYLSNGRAAGEMDWKAIGGTWGCATSLLNTWKADEANAFPYPGFDKIVAEIGKNHKLLARYVHKYFEDIRAHIQSMRNVLAPGARCHYIVGNSKFYDTILPVEQIYASLFEDAGLVNVGIETIRKRTSKKELYEFIVNAHSPRKTNGTRAEKATVDRHCRP